MSENEKVLSENSSADVENVMAEEKSPESAAPSSKADFTKPPVIEFENVTKSYYLYKSDRQRFKAMFTSNRGVTRHPVLNNLSFKVHQGESVGFIGRNGAGKSTILKLVTGVAFPDSGDITVRGKIAALLELTAGFYPEMTGRENIYMKGYLLGLNDSEIAEIEQDVIDFADIDEYIDQPVRTYSSGMKTRLGFSINISIKPDVLVVDEALSVGDARFKKKCQDSINRLVGSGVTVLFVSHSPAALLDTCTRAIYLKDGSICFDGDVAQALEMYESDVEEIRKRRREKKREENRKVKDAIKKLKEKRSNEAAKAE